MFIVSSPIKNKRLDCDMICPPNKLKRRINKAPKERTLHNYHQNRITVPLINWAEGEKK